MENKNYEVMIKSATSELSFKERLNVRSFTNGITLDSAIKEDESLIISPDKVVLLEVHNEKAEQKDYSVMVIIDKDGEMWYTSSTSFMNSALTIMDEVKEAESQGEDIGDWQIKCFRVKSKNYQGKTFLNCQIV